MARGKKTGGRDFAPGKVAGPGRTPVPVDLKDLRKTQLEAFLRRGFEFGEMRQDDLRKVLADPNAKALDLTLASCFARAISGSLPHQKELWDRLFGNSAPALLDQLGEMGAVIAATTVQRPLQNAGTEQLIAVMAMLKRTTHPPEGDEPPAVVDAAALPESE